jgi:NNP family nitrate/nitrite transporter-like MFS transporter
MSAPLATPSRASAARVLALSTAGFTLLFAVWLMYGVLGIPMKAELHLSVVQFAWLTSAAVLSGSLLRLPFGILADRWGGRSVMIATLLATAVPCALTAWCHSFTTLLLAALGFGISGNAFTSGIAWNAAWNPPERQGFALGVFGAGNVGASLTKFLAPALLPILPATLCGGLLPGGWRAVPLIYAVALVAMAALVWRVCPSPDRRPGRHRALSSMLEPLAIVRVWRFGLYYVVVFGAYVALSLWLPSYYHDVYRLSLAHAALLTALFIFPASLLRPLGGWLSDRFGPRPITYGVFIAMLACSIALALPPGILALDVATFTALVVALGAGMGIGKAAVYRYVPDYFPDDVGAVGGLVGCLGALGGVALPLAFGYLRQATGHPESCFLALALIIALSLGWLHLVVVAMRRRDAQRPAATPMTAIAP